MLLISVLIFGSIGVFRRLMGFPSGFSAMCRGLVGSLFVIAYIKLRGGRLRGGIGRRSFLLAIASGALIGINWIFLFEAFIYTTVPVATLFNHTEPFFVFFLAAIFLGEKLTLRKTVCSVIALIGMVLLSGVVEGGFSDAGEIKGVLYGLISGFIYACVIILNKKTTDIDMYRRTAIQLAASGVVVIPYVILNNEFAALPQDLTSWLLLAFVCLVHTGLAYCLHFGGMDGLSAYTVGLITYIDPITALILSAVILDEELTLLGVIGAVLILGATLVSEMRTGRREASDTGN
ncbi:MAG: DMT family transporter [Lachnospiraceae bacterium]|nr:DMT family transporter [Lachnospiraceae bacterium]